MRIRLLLSLALALHAFVPESRADMASLPPPDYPDFVAAAGRPAAFTKDELCETAARVAAANNLPISFFTNLIHQESGFRPYVVSRAGAQGIAQFMPYVAAEHGLADPFEPASALIASGKLLAELVAQFGNLGLAAAAYNAGPRRVQEWLDSRGMLPAETKQYVFNITGYPADQWARQVLAEEVMMSDVARCSRLNLKNSPVRPAANEFQHAHKTSAPTAASSSEKGTLGIKAGGLRRGLPQPSQFAIGKPITRLVSRLERDHKNRAARARRYEPAMNRFLAVATPKIMREEKRGR